MQLSFRNTCFLALAAMSCLVASQALAAAPNVSYMASGIFTTPPISGTDLFQLQGEPFSITIVANEAAVSKNHGPQWAVYNLLKLTGTVQSRLLPTPIGIASSGASVLLAVGNPAQDMFKLGAPVRVISITLSVTANIIMPKGIILNDHVLPFTAPVTLTPANATMTYTDGTNVTTLGVNGTLTAVVTGAAALTGVTLHSSGAQSLTSHADGTQSVRSLTAGAVNLGASSDQTALQFYASGVRDAQDIHVRIGGDEVPVLYTGPANHFPGLDQVSVQVPRTLAGRGDVEVQLTVDGQSAAPVRLRIE